MELRTRPFIGIVSTYEGRHFYFSLKHKDIGYSGYLFKRGVVLRYSLFDQYEKLISCYQYNIHTTEFVRRVDK